MKKLCSILVVALSIVLGVFTNTTPVEAQEKMLSFVNNNEIIYTGDSFELEIININKEKVEIIVDEDLELLNEVHDNIKIKDNKTLEVLNEDTVTLNLKALQSGSYKLIANKYNDFPNVESITYEVNVIDKEIKVEEKTKDLKTDNEEKQSLSEEINSAENYEVQTRAGVSISSRDIGYKHTGTATAPNGQSAWFNNQDISALYANGEDAFCVEPWTIAGDGTKYTGSIQERLTLDKIIYYGFVSEGKTDYARAVVTLMIWEEYGYYPTSHTVPNYASAKASINSKITNHAVRPSFHNKEYTIKLGESLTIEDTNYALGVKELVVNSANVDYSFSGNKLTITPKKDSIDGNLQFNKISKVNIGTSILYSSNDPMEQAVYSSNLPDPMAYFTKIKVLKHGDVELTKKDFESGALLADVKYGLYSDANATQLIKEVTTDSTGKIMYHDLLIGTYYVKELETLEGYVYDDTITKVVVKAQETTKLELTNKRQKTSIEILKAHMQGREVLAGAEFDLYLNETGTLFDEDHEWTFDEDGNPDFSMLTKIETGLTDIEGRYLFDDKELGQYIVAESKAPLYYARNPKDIRIVNAFSTDNTTLKYEYTELFNNLPQLGSFLLQKTAKESGLALAGTKYKVYANYSRMFIESPKDLLLEDGTYDLSNLTEIAEIITDAEGIARLEELHEGKYYYQESQQLIDRKIDPELYEFTIAFEDDVTQHVEVKVEHTNDLRQYAYRLYKQDSKNLTILLDGAKFSVTNTLTGESLGTYVTGAFYYEGTPNKTYALYTDADVFVKDVTADSKGEVLEYLEAGVYKLKDKADLDNVLSTQGVFKGSFMMYGMEHGITYDVCEINPPQDYEMPQNPCMSVTPNEDFGVEIIENYRVNDLVVVNVKTGISNPFVFYTVLMILAVALMLVLQKKYLVACSIGHTNENAKNSIMSFLLKESDETAHTEFDKSHSKNKQEDISKRTNLKENNRERKE